MIEQDIVSTSGSIINAESVVDSSGINISEKRPRNGALLRLRKEKGITQIQLGEIIGAHNNSISNYENLKEYPDEDTAQKIASFFGVNSQAIFPAWIQVFTSSRSGQSQEVVEIPESTIPRGELERALETEKSDELDDMVANDLLKKDIEETLSSLRDIEAKVLKLRFGIGCSKNYTLRQIGQEWKSTPERIRQIEARALRKMRHKSRTAKLVDYLDMPSKKKDELTKRIDDLKWHFNFRTRKWLTEDLSEAYSCYWSELISYIDNQQSDYWGKIDSLGIDPNNDEALKSTFYGKSKGNFCSLYQTYISSHRTSLEELQTLKKKLKSL